MLRNTILLGAVALVCTAPTAFAQDALGLNESINLALANNPSVAAASMDTKAAGIAARGARALTNPEIVVAPSIVGTAGSDSVFLAIQPLEVNGSRKARTRTANAEANAAAATAAVTRNDLTRDVKVAYWQVALAQSTVDLNEDNVKFAEAMYAAAKRQVEVGTAPGAQVMKTELELTRARQELLKAQTELNLAKSSLNTLLGRPSSADFTITDKLVYFPIDVDASKVRDIAFANRPELCGSIARIAASRAAIDASKAARRPDLALQARKESWDGDGGIALGFTLPILDWGSARANKRRAETSLSAEELRAAAVRNQVSLEVRNAVTNTIAADKLVKDYENGVLSQSQQLADMAQKGYKSGAISYLEVLEAQRTLRDVRTDYYSALAELWESRAELEWAMATDLVTPKEAGK